MSWSSLWWLPTENHYLHVSLLWILVLIVFCHIKLCDLTGVSYLLISVYMPTDCGPASYDDYLNTLGELEGFIDSPNCNFVIVVGDLNVDFDRENMRNC